MIKKICAVYCITNTVNNKVYIGSSNNIKYRWSRHRRYLINNKHWNKHLQSAYNLYGQINIVYSILEECPEDILEEREQFWVDYFIKNGIEIYNNSSIVNATLRGKKGKDHPAYGHKVDKKIIETLIKFNKENPQKGEDHPFYGKHHTAESNEKNRKSHLGKPGYWKGKELPETTKENLRKSRVGSIPWNKGKKGTPLSEEAKQNLSDFWTGKAKGPFTEEHKKNLSLAHIGKKDSEETKHNKSKLKIERRRRNKVEI